MSYLKEYVSVVPNGTSTKGVSCSTSLNEVGKLTDVQKYSTLG